MWYSLNCSARAASAKLGTTAGYARNSESMSTPNKNGYRVVHWTLALINFGGTKMLNLKNHWFSNISMFPILNRLQCESVSPCIDARRTDFISSSSFFPSLSLNLLEFITAAVNQRGGEPARRMVEEHTSSLQFRVPTLPSKVALVFRPCIQCQTINLKMNITAEGKFGTAVPGQFSQN